jgi:hypothetical protein
MNSNARKKIQAEGDRRMNMIETMMHGKKVKDTKRHEKSESKSFEGREKAAYKRQK